ncbi:MAG: site-specific integrase [Gallionella sp.]|jgi:integrase|nr:site-specific integrase [Gallionella sp.]
MTKLTKTTVDRELPGEKDRFVWDIETKGFGLKISPTGTKTFVYQYRTPEGKTRRCTIGKFSDSLTADQARKIAKDREHEVRDGRDPMGEKKARRNAITVNELLDMYVKSEKFASNAETTQATDRGRIERHLRPLLGKEFAGVLTADQVKRAHRAIKEGKTACRVKTVARGLAKVTGGEGTANKSVLLLSVAYSWAMENGFAKSNPAAKMKCGGTGTRDTILDNAKDYGRLFDTLQKMENEKRIRPAAADAIRFIALTGARRGEATGLRWQWVDLKSGLITLPPKAHKTGHRTGKPRIIALPTEAQAIIARQPAGKPDDYVFRPSKGNGALSLGPAWPAVRTEAKLPEKLGLHGLRHSIGTHLAMAGASAVELMETLGHKQITTTLRYVHFAERARSTLAERAASVAMAGLRGQTEKASVTKLRRKSNTAA